VHTDPGICSGLDRLYACKATGVSAEPKLLMKTATLARIPAKYCYAAVGWCAVGLALAGTVIPGLPTTIFVIIASYCFSRSSERFSRWLWDNRWLGPKLHRYASGGGMSRSAKRACLTAMWASVSISAALLANLHVAMAVLTIGLGIVGTLSVLFGVRTVPENVTPAAPRPTDATSA
jgi:uncharacterized membrane protein YbaN (DUF454 family)